jgi:hypothetical protein
MRLLVEEAECSSLISSCVARYVGIFCKTRKEQNILFIAVIK